jgi:hypothetical protein
MDLFLGEAHKASVQDWRDQFWISASVHFFFGLEVGFNLAEFADFLLGWFGLDICRDDGQDDEKEEPKKMSKEPKYKTVNELVK